MAQKTKILKLINEILVDYNPQGGVPMKQLQLTFLDDPEKYFDIQNVCNYTEQRYHLGYCSCGKRLVLSTQQAIKLNSLFKEKGIKIKKTSIKLRLIKMFFKDVDKEILTNILK